MASYQMTKTQNAPPPSSRERRFLRASGGGGVSSRRHRSRTASPSSSRTSARRPTPRPAARTGTSSARKSARRIPPRISTDGRACPDRGGSSERARQSGGTPLLVPELPDLYRSRARQAPMKTEPMFSIEKDAGGNLRIVIARPDGSRIVLPAHSWRSERVQRPPLAAFLKRNHLIRHRGGIA
jgi:hypothetical protein